MKTYDTNYFKKRVKELTGNEYKVVGEYTKAINSIKMLHTKCKREYFATPHDFLQGTRCPICFEESKTGRFKRNTKQFKKELKLKYGNEYKVIGEYKGARTKTKVKHNVCGNTYEVSPDNILRGKKCPYCSNLTPYDDISYKQHIENLYPNEYTIIGKYKTMHDKIEIRHNKCGISWFVEPNQLMRNRSCPHCHASKGEQRVENFLILNKIKFVKQYYFEDCRATLRKPLLFDFAVFNKYDKLLYCIEYDGIQHYEDVAVFGGKKTFLDCLYRDTVKNHYCKDHKIKLIRIPYWDYGKIEKILSNI